MSAQAAPAARTPGAKRAGPGEHLFDLAYHQAGAWRGLPEGMAFPASDLDGYRYLTEATFSTAGALWMVISQLRNGVETEG